jgi:hypothetical protein
MKLGEWNGVRSEKLERNIRIPEKQLKHAIYEKY